MNVTASAAIIQSRAPISSGARPHEHARKMPDWVREMRQAENLERAVARLPRVHRHPLSFELRRSTQLIQVCVMRCARAASHALEAELKQLLRLAAQLHEQLVQAHHISAFDDAQAFADSVGSSSNMANRSASWLRQLRCAAA